MTALFHHLGSGGRSTKKELFTLNPKPLQEPLLWSLFSIIWAQGVDRRGRHGAAASSEVAAEAPPEEFELLGLEVEGFRRFRV